MVDWLRRYWPLVLLVLMQALFIYWPVVDLRFSAYFYQPTSGFLLADHWSPQLIETLFSGVQVVMLLMLPWLMLSSVYWVGAGEAGLRRKLYFLFLVTIVASVFAVTLLTGESGRAPPVEVQVFAGAQQFSAAFQPASECDSACSFVSDTSAIGFLLIAFAWVFNDRRWFWIGVVAGAIVGLVEIAAGQHFLSDVVFAFWVIYAACLLFARIMLGSVRISGESG